MAGDDHAANGLERPDDLAQLGRELGTQCVPQAHRGHDNGHQDEPALHHIAGVVGQVAGERMLQNRLNHGVVHLRVERIG